MKKLALLLTFAFTVVALGQLNAQEPQKEKCKKEQCDKTAKKECKKDKQECAKDKKEG